MIALTGASGNLGQLTLSRLIEKTPVANIVAIVRNPAKLGTYHDSGINIRKADYDDMTALVEALDGVKTLLLISSSAYGSEASRHELNVVQAAEAAGVRKIIYTGTLRPGPNAVFLAGRTCWATEKAIRDKRFAFTFFRNSMYFETIPLFIGSVVQDGQIYYAGGDGKVSFVSRADIAEALAIVMTEPDSHHNAEYQITGEEAISFNDLAALFKSEKGLDAAYHDISDADFVAELSKLKMPQGEIDFTVSMASSIRTGEFSDIDDQLEKLLGRKRKVVRNYIQEL
ncbi:SDR family oxidoreductase [Olivibacter sp. SDN3]|uniref:SDR family oxidoreductase n=1 Tax=Olivibacter sp. SDN3 TaxID=2764720 RepID=UPI0016510C81|nr:SDR family oxidoreductase [Olivibacter sp. SDN3]QNL47875.1 SDR family oxidoreductase [Olivibacter sp. SDN3]